MAEDRTVAMIGSGIVNLVTAFYLVESGYKVTLYDACSHPSMQSWRQQGCTFGGDDARIFSLNEGRHHHNKGPNQQDYIDKCFKNTIRDGGWLVSRDLASPADEDWLMACLAVPRSYQPIFDRDIISFNQKSAPLWRKLKEDYSDLFNQVGLCEGLLRTYASHEQHERASLREAEIGAIVRQIPRHEIDSEFPVLSDAVGSGKMYAAMEVVGFSLNIHRFSLKIIDHLKRKGCRFLWNAKVKQIIRDTNNRVLGLRLDDDVVVQSRNYVISPGAFGNHLLHGFHSEGKIAAMVGMWLTVPDDPNKSLLRPLKVSRSGFASSGAAEGANVIPGTNSLGQRVIHISSGHGFIGTDAYGVEKYDLSDLSKPVHETALDYFPSHYGKARDLSLIESSLRFCIRPWTSSGLGIFEIAESIHGGFAIITGGHNTGGFAQSPSVGQAVLNALDGLPHPMHDLYDPRRVDLLNENVLRLKGAVLK